MARIPMVRIVSTLILVAVVLAGLAVGASQDEPPRFAAARDGDAWTYAQQHFAGGNATDDPVVRVFERVGAAHVLAGDGGWRGGSAVREHRVLESPCGAPVDAAITSVATREGGLGHVVEDGVMVGGGGCVRTSFQTGIIDPREAIDFYHVHDGHVVGRDPLPCGHTNPLAGGRPPAVMVAAGTCAGALRLLGWEDGAAVYEDEAGQQVWFRPDAPVPVRIRQPLDTSVRVLELMDFQAGQAPAAFAKDVAGPGLGVHKAQQGRPVEGGFATQFPLDAALVEARQDSEFAALFDRGFLVDAAYSTIRVTSQYSDEIHRIWDLRASDGSSAYGLSVRAVETHDDGASDLPLWEPTREARTTIELSARSFGDDALPAAPGEMPSVQETIALWQSLGGGQPDAYAFSHRCAATCDETTSTLTVGSVSAQRRLPDVVCVNCISANAWDKSTLSVDGQGTVLSRNVEAPVEVRESSLAVPTAQEPNPQAARPAPLADGSFSPMATGLGIMAVLAGLGYIIYTLGKAGIITLWHRPVEDHPMRQQIVATVQAEPGIHHKELMRRVGGGNHVVTFHVRRLQAADKVIAQAGPRYTCYFPKGKVDRHVMAAAPVLKADVAHQMLGAIAKRPGRSGQELAQELGVVPGSITFHAKRMRAAGLIEAERVGRSLAYRVTPVGERALRVGLAASLAA